MNIYIYIKQKEERSMKYEDIKKDNPVFLNIRTTSDKTKRNVFYIDYTGKVIKGTISNYEYKKIFSDDKFKKVIYWWNTGTDFINNDRLNEIIGYTKTDGLIFLYGKHTSTEQIQLYFSPSKVLYNHSLIKAIIKNNKINDINNTANWNKKYKTVYDLIIS